MKIYSIYKVTNKVNGKLYIGFDSNWPNRKINHKSKAKIGSNRHFHNAIRKYGWDNFEWEVICQSLDGEYLLKVMEPYFIKYYNTFNNGYNYTLGGEGNVKFWNIQTLDDINIDKYSYKSNKRIKTDPHNVHFWVLVDPTGKEYYIKNLSQFCREHNLCDKNLYAVNKGRLPHSNGWIAKQVSSI
jgi:group I intron endonuclease